MRSSSRLSARSSAILFGGLFRGLSLGGPSLGGLSLAGLPLLGMSLSGSAFSGDSRRKQARRAIGKAARQVRAQWSPSERRRRADAADEMQMRLLSLLGLRPALASIPNVRRPTPHC